MRRVGTVTRGSVTDRPAADGPTGSERYLS